MKKKKEIEKPRLGLGFSVILVLVLSDPFLSDLFSEFAFAFEKREKETKREKREIRVFCRQRGRFVFTDFFFFLLEVYLLCVTDQTYVSFRYALFTRVRF